MSKFRMFPALLGAASVFPVAALADVTADDVVTNMLAPSRALGFDVAVEPVRDGGTVTIDSMVMTYALPLGVGTARVDASGLVLIEEGDGSVAIRYPETYEMRISVETAEEGDVFSATVAYGGFDTPYVATGRPGAITYEGSFDNARFEMRDITVPDEADFDMSFAGTFSGSNRYTITEGDIVEMTISGTTDRVNFTTESRDPNGAVSTGEQTLTGGTTEMTMRIPAGKVDLLNLDDALRAGLAITARTADARLEGSNVTTAEAFEMRQTTAYTMESNDISLTAEGLVLAGVYTDLAFEFLLPPELPFPIAGSMARSEGEMRLPLLETDGAVPVDLLMTLEDLSLDEAIWALFDPEAQLPRDPMTLKLDLSGEAALARDPLDIMRMMEVDLTEVPLGTLQSIALDQLLLQAVGAEVTGSGQFAIDNEDYETFEGMPAPSGSVDLSVTGANGLLDTLVAMGLLPEEQAMGARMMMGMFGTPGNGEDVINSTIEVTEDGQVLANGQRLR